LPISVTAPHEGSAGGNVIEFTLESTDGRGVTVIEENRFRGPTDEY